ncbi:MAG: DEAD/DEAH box helicase family protein [Holophagales bacterium]|nr:DEAD/DEAH box helicase family protein [Holophagales bacterium]
MPYPFQQEILEKLRASATSSGSGSISSSRRPGRGKTMVAAFDYRSLCRERGIRPTLLFVAHRDEILDQALAAYRTVLRDHSFGERLGGGHSPGTHDHLFATIQSLDRQDLVARVGGARWDVVVVDEFHHAAASTYRRLLDSLEPGILLGLTATPERSTWRTSSASSAASRAREIRLWDAIDRQLVAPVDYFGISDDTKLDEVRWARGRYVESDLETLYTGDDARAALVLAELQRKSGDARRVRALGFCVGVSHAEFMARRFSEWGVPALAVHGESTAEVRRGAKALLLSGKIAVLFTCDLYNEGVDLPEVDTLLLLRPTASASLPAAARAKASPRGGEDVRARSGLHRPAPEGVPFRIGPPRTYGPGEGRPARGGRAWLSAPPGGVQPRADRVVRDQVLGHLRQALDRRSETLVRETKELAAAGGAVTLARFLSETGRDLDDVYRSSSAAGRPCGPRPVCRGRRRLGETISCRSVSGGSCTSTNRSD